MRLPKSLFDIQSSQADDASPHALWSAVSQLVAALRLDDAAPNPAPAADGVQHDLLVRFSPGHEAGRVLQQVFGQAIEITRGHAGGTAIADAAEATLVRVRIGGGLDLDGAIDMLSGHAGVELVERDGIATIQLASNDPYVSGASLWGMYGDQSTPANAYGSQAAEAWMAGHIGASNVVTGVNDTGIDYTHPDLYLNVWLNAGEVPVAFRGALADRDGDSAITFRDLNAKDAGGQLVYRDYVADLNANGYIDGGDLLRDARWVNGADEDANGYANDLIGWDFVNNDNDPFDDNGHGTHVSGTIGAVGGNAQGVAGVNWNTSILAMKTMDSQGAGYYSSAIKATNYFTAMSASQPYADFASINNSWSGTSFSQSLLDSVANAARNGILYVAAAGNGGSDQVGDNNDVTGNYPSNLSTLSAVGYESVIAVAALTSSGGLGSYSNYGNTTVDLAAPGSYILSTVPGGGYGYMSGTSMATPHVAGAVALYAAAHPDASAAEIVNALRASVLRTDSLVAATAWDGRLDVGTLLAGASAPVPPPAPTAPTQTVAISSVSDNVDPVSGAIANGGVTNDTTPTLVGTLSGALASGQTVAVYRAAMGGVAAKVGAAAVSGTSWSYTDAQHADGTYSYTARVEDGAGGAGPASASYTIVQDATAPAQAVNIASVTAGTATIGNGGTTTDTTPTLNGTVTSALAAGETLVIVRDGAVVARQQLAGTTWSYTDATSTGAHTYVGIVEDAAGNRGSASSGFSLNIAAPAPTTTSYYGTTGSDTVTGDAGDNVVSGLPSGGSSTGRGTIDTLIGGGGSDTFVLGDSRGIFYQDRNGNSQGLKDYALVRDFLKGADHIQLVGAVADYTFAATTIKGVSGLGIYVDVNADGKYGSPDELIGLVANVSTLASTDLLFV